MSDHAIEGWSKLREPFPLSRIGKLPKGGVKLDYVGHGAVTERLLEVDPGWYWEPFSLDSDGSPLIRNDGKAKSLWIRLTVGGITRIGVGSCPTGQQDAEKVLIGDALRNAAMRFGVALDLWVRGQAEDDEQVSTPVQYEAPAPPEPKASDEDVAGIVFALSMRDGEDKEAVRKEWAKANLPVPADLTASQVPVANKILDITEN